MGSRVVTHSFDEPSLVPDSRGSGTSSLVEALMRVYFYGSHLGCCRDLSQQSLRHQSSRSQPNAVLDRGHPQCPCSPRRRRSCAITIDSNRQWEPSSYDCRESLSSQRGNKNKAPTDTRQRVYPEVTSIPYQNADGRPPIYTGRHMSMDGTVIHYQGFVLFLASSSAHPLTLRSKCCSMKYCSIEHTPGHDNHLNNSRDVVHEQGLIGHIAQAMEQYLTGRQEKLWTLQIPVNGDIGPETYKMLKRLFSEFWHSLRRQPFRRGFHIHFIEIRETAQSKQTQERYSLEHVRALTDQFQ
jgi:hypothetical protein